MLAISRVSLVLAVLLLLALAPVEAQPDYANATVETVEVAPGIAMLAGAGGNIGVVTGKDGIFLIDDDYAPMTDKVRAAVAELAEGPIRFVLNTHWHGDHTGGNESLGQAGSLIVAHEGVRRRMEAGQLIEFLGYEVPPAPAVALPVVTYEDSVTFHLNGHEIHAFHVPPSHTDGDSVVHFRDANVVHTGDLFFNRMYPFFDTSSGGSLDGMIAVTDQLLELVGPETKIIPGHGPLATRADLEAYRKILGEAKSRIAPMVSAGKTLEEIQAARPLADFDEAWGGGFLGPDQFLALVYSDLSR